jgi:hypothetical protein
MSEAVTVSGTPVLSLNDGGIASFDRAHSTATALVFNYTVAPGQVTSDLVVSGITLSSASAIADLAGNNANLSGGGADLGLRVNTAATGPAGPSGGNFAIGGSTQLELFGPSAASVSFAAGAAGTLKLDAATQFTGHVSGLAGHDAIDLANFDFDEDSNLAYKANNTHSGGTLTVQDGEHIARIALLGQYMASSFAMASDGSGGTLITDPPPNQQHLVSASHA